MAKKSRKVAAKYSELSRERKKEKQKLRTRRSPQLNAASAPKNRETADAPILEKRAPITATRVQRGPAQSIPAFPYVGRDLKRIGMLAGAAIAILVILSFVLG